MAGDLAWSERRIAFTSEAVATMRRWAEMMEQEKQIICWSLAFDAQGQLTTGLCAFYRPGESPTNPSFELPPQAIEDRVGDVTFHWVGEETGLKEVRKYCIDIGWGRGSRLIPLD